MKSHRSICIINKRTINLLRRINKKNTLYTILIKIIEIRTPESVRLKLEGKKEEDAHGFVAPV